MTGQTDVITAASVIAAQAGIQRATATHRTTPQRAAASSSPRRGFTLIAVLVIVGSALLVATSLLFIAQAEVAGSSNAAHTAQARATMAGGMEIIINALDGQREAILPGALPELEEQYDVYEHGSMLGVVRLLPITPAGERVSPEAGKLDINHPNLTSGMLVATGLIEQDLSEAIITHRDAQPGKLVHSVAELLHVEGVTPELLYGPLEDLARDDLDASPEQDVAQRIAGRLGDQREHYLADVLTVFAIEPDLQRDGRQRINLNVPWSEELGIRLDERFGDGAGELIKSIMDQGTSFDDDAALFRVLRFFDVPVEDWADILDGLSTSEKEYRFGRLDINTASEAALLALPTMTPELATQIIRSRELLSDDERATIAWPAMRGIIEPDAYIELGQWLTTRSWTYRLRIAAGEVTSEDPDGELHHPLVYEVVIDLASPRPRVAYLRDVTLVPTTMSLALDRIESNLEREDWYEDEEDVEDTAVAAPQEEPDEEDESWISDDLADEDDDASSPPAPADPADLPDSGQPQADPEQPARRRLGRWRP